MGSPFRTLSTFLSPKVFSPLSPKLSVANKSEHLISNTVISPTVQGLNHGVKKLELAQHSVKKNLFGAPVKIYVTEHDVAVKNDLLINTPNKKNITRNGLEDHKFLNILGRGSFGEVIRGIHKGKIVATKVVKNTKRFPGEKNALNLNHENVVTTLDIIERSKENYSLIIMEYFPNSRHLQNILEDPEINMERKIIKFCTDICKGLEYCHSKGVLHLDMKPKNILGTILYTAPEILLGDAPTEKSDVYSLGILLWQIQHRTSPYSNMDNVETVIYKVIKWQLRPEMEPPKDAFSDLYQSCWNSNPKSRPSVSRVLKDLSKF